MARHRVHILAVYHIAQRKEREDAVNQACERKVSDNHHWDTVELDCVVFDRGHQGFQECDLMIVQIIMRSVQYIVDG